MLTIHVQVLFVARASAWEAGDTWGGLSLYVRSCPSLSIHAIPARGADSGIGGHEGTDYLVAIGEGDLDAALSTSAQWARGEVPRRQRPRALEGAARPARSIRDAQHTASPSRAIAVSPTGPTGRSDLLQSSAARRCYTGRPRFHKRCALGIHRATQQPTCLSPNWTVAFLSASVFGSSIPCPVLLTVDMLVLPSLDLSLEARLAFPPNQTRL